jgi:hypothetical protein
LVGDPEKEPVAGDDDDLTSDDDATDTDYSLIFEPDFARQGQSLKVEAAFVSNDGEGSPLDFSGEGNYFISGVPDFGKGVFVRKVEIGQSGVALDIFVDAAAPLGERVVGIVINDGSKLLEGVGLFFILPEATGGFTNSF